MRPHFCSQFKTQGGLEVSCQILWHSAILTLLLTYMPELYMDTVSREVIQLVIKCDRGLCKHTYTYSYTVRRTYIAEVDETMFPGDAVSLLWPANNLDSPSVGVDLCSINPLQLSCQEDKDCPWVQQGHPGIHERENTSRGESIRSSVTASQAERELLYLTAAK